ncbi:MAG: type II toxin-antitoxin system VapC family toxin [Micrococcales bacterium]|nr:type II toxin-antitoxin system VapC family toxin [Micrococcales bacterium]
MSENPPGRTLLLDTNALLDLTVDSHRIVTTVRQQLADPAVSLLVSAASAWEVAIKVRNGKLPGGERLVASWDQSLRDIQADQLTMDADDAIRAGSLPWAHKDPFDRMLVAQAIRYNLSLVTSDQIIVDAPMVTTIDTRSR